jgi:hypothetical protein
VAAELAASQDGFSPMVLVTYLFNNAILGGKKAMTGDFYQNFG